MKDLTTKPNFEVLDCLRGIAAVYVVINHCRGHLLIGGSELAQIIPISKWSIWTKLYYALLQFTSLGREFVVLFFVLSGFSIAFSLRNQQNAKIFYFKRLVRLYPPFVLALIWAALVFSLISIYEPLFNKDLKSVFYSWKSTGLNLIYISNGAYIAQFWSLVHEVIFYLLAPLVFLNRKVYYIVSILLYTIGLYISWDNVAGQTIITSFLLDYNFYFIVGVWLFNNYSMIYKKISANRVKTYFISIFLIVLMVVIKFYTTDHNKISCLIAVVFSVFLVVNFQKNKITTRLLLYLGTMSYTLYITHFATIKIYNLILIKMNFAEVGTKIQNPIIWFGGIFLCIIISYLFYVIAEKPSKKILEKFRN